MLCGSALTRLKHELQLAREEAVELRDVGTENKRLRDQVFRLKVELEKQQNAAAAQAKGASSKPEATETLLAAARAEVVKLKKEIERLKAQAVEGHSERLAQRAKARAQRLSQHGGSSQRLSNRSPTNRPPSPSPDAMLPATREDEEAVPPPPEDAEDVEDELESDREWLALGWSESSTADGKGADNRGAAIPELVF